MKHPVHVFFCIYGCFIFWNRCKMSSKQVSSPRYRLIHGTTFSRPNIIKQHEVRIENFLTYVCIDFISTMSSWLVGQVKEVDALQTHIIHFAICYILWASEQTKKNHSSSNSKLEWSQNTWRVAQIKSTFVLSKEWNRSLKC